MPLPNEVILSSLTDEELLHYAPDDNPWVKELLRRYSAHFYELFEKIEKMEEELAELDARIQDREDDLRS